MGIKKTLRGLVNKKKKSVPTETENGLAIQQIADADLFPIVKIPEISLQKYNKIPISGLASLGAAFSKLPLSARTITQTKTSEAALKETLFVGINPRKISGFLRADQYGTVGNIMQVNEQGKQVIAGRMRFKPVDNLPLNESYSITMPIDPTLMVVAVAVMAIEQKIDKLQESVENVLRFLELEKQSKQRGNLKKLTEIAEDYKVYCEDKEFCENRNFIVQKIQTEALADIEFYKENTASQLQKQKSVHTSLNADSLMNDVIRELAEYQLSCYLYSYSTFMDTMLRKDFSSENITRIKERMQTVLSAYDNLYLDCYSQIEKYQHSSIDTKVINSVGVAIKGVGKAVGSIPFIKDGQIDETLIEIGTKLNNKSNSVIGYKLETIKGFKDTHIMPFIDNLSSIDLMYNRENGLLTDGENIYALQDTAI